LGDSRPARRRSRLRFIDRPEERLQAKSSTRAIQFAVLTRIHSIERPFLNGYLEHYLDTLGYQRMFIIHGEEADPAWLERWAAERR
jgi:hypothetical protein